MTINNRVLAVASLTLAATVPFAPALALAEPPDTGNSVENAPTVAVSLHGPFCPVLFTHRNR